jgi:uncharacterized protein YigA (DUF484 family)
MSQVYQNISHGKLKLEHGQHKFVIFQIRDITLEIKREIITKIELDLCKIMSNTILNDLLKGN